MKLTRLPSFLILAISLCGIVPHTTLAQTARRVEVVAKRYDFTPGEITVSKGSPLTIVLTSKDVDHGIKFKDFNVSLNAKKGETKEITFTPDKIGTFIGQCSVFCGSGHGSMKLTLHVTE